MFSHFHALRSGGTGRRAFSRTIAALLVLAAFAFLGCALIPVDTATEGFLAGTVLCSILLLARFEKQGWRRLTLLLLCLLLTLRYLSWRVTDTFVYYDPVSFAGAIILFMAELYSMVIMLLGLFTNFAPITRDVAMLPLDADAPAVDVLVPSYNEEPDLLAVTLCAATQIAYPPGRLTVHLLDDGGTDEKCAAADPRRAAAARERRRALQALCARFGVTYRTRARNHHAKAGNINDTLPALTGDLVLILDADHVPTVDILQRTVPLFRGDPKLFLVQTPHFFMNPDTVEKNFDLFLKMPGENEMFHRAIQSGLDFWNCSIFCGSAAVLHRGHLLAGGGIATSTVTEDAETALALHAKGLRSAYVARPMVAGLAPETFAGMITQRVRWAQGMLQILLLSNPLSRPGLSLAQRLGYLGCTLYWLFPYARVVFLLAPVAYLIFGLRIYAAGLSGVVAYVLPHMLASSVSSNLLYGRFRWPAISHIHETLQSLLMLRALWMTLRNPHAPDFKVTPKREHLAENFISPLVRPFYIVFAIVLAALPIGLWRLAADPDHRSVVFVTLIWELFNLLVLMAALGALFERRQRRALHRMRADLPARLRYAGNTVTGRVTDLSMGGTRFEAAAAMPDLTTYGPLEIEIDAPHIPQPVRLRTFLRTQHGGAAGLAFAADEGQFARIVSLVHGDSGRWSGFWSDSARSTRMSTAYVLLVRMGGVALTSHLLHLGRRAVTGTWRRIGRFRSAPHSETIDVVAADAF